MSITSPLPHLTHLEAESIRIMREIVAQFAGLPRRSG